MMKLHIVHCVGEALSEYYLIHSDPPRRKERAGYGLYDSSITRSQGVLLEPMPVAVYNDEIHLSSPQPRSPSPSFMNWTRAG